MHSFWKEFDCTSGTFNNIVKLSFSFHSTENTKMLSKICQLLNRTHANDIYARDNRPLFWLFALSQVLLEFEQLPISFTNRDLEEEGVTWTNTDVSLERVDTIWTSLQHISGVSIRCVVINEWMSSTKFLVNICH